MAILFFEAFVPVVGDPTDVGGESPSAVPVVVKNLRYDVGTGDIKGDVRRQNAKTDGVTLEGRKEFYEMIA